jgi:hypothetical protein
MFKHYILTILPPQKLKMNFITTSCTSHLGVLALKTRRHKGSLGTVLKGSGTPPSDTVSVWR